MSTEPKISLLVVTNRPGGIEILKDNLDRQTFRDFEVVLVDELYDWRKEEVAEYLKEYQLTHLKPRPKLEGDAWNLNKAYNDGIAASRGKFLVSLQDYIWISANGLHRFWETYEMHPLALVTGVGHKYKNPDKLDHRGRISCFKELRHPTVVEEFDDRMRFEFGLREQNSTYYELNWSSFPMGMKFDEEMDKCFGGDNVVFAKASGLTVYVDRINECKGYSTKLFGRPGGWEENHFNKIGYAGNITTNNA